MADSAFEATGIVGDAEEELSVNQLRQLMLEELSADVTQTEFVCDTIQHVSSTGERDTR